MVGLGQTSLVSALAAAITQQENVPASYNNPGAIMNPQTGQLQQYATLADGQAALDNQIELNISRGLTLEQFFAGEPGVYAGYAPAAAGNDPTTYAANVSAWTGIPTDVPLSQLDSGTYQTDFGVTVDTSALDASTADTSTDTSDDTDETDSGDDSGDTSGNGIGIDTTTLAVLAAIAFVGVVAVIHG